MIELIGRHFLDTRARHRERRPDIVAGASHERDKHPGLVLAHAAAIAEGHLPRVVRVALPFSHRKARVADLLGGPVLERLHLVDVCLEPGCEILHELFDRGVVAVDRIVDRREPAGFFLPRGKRRKDELRRNVRGLGRARLVLDRRDVIEPP